VFPFDVLDTGNASGLDFVVASVFSTRGCISVDLSPFCTGSCMISYVQGFLAKAELEIFILCKARLPCFGIFICSCMISYVQGFLA
jgi:hypothetical protein